MGPGGGGVAAGLSGVGSPAEGCWRSGGGDAAAWPGGGASVSFLTGPPGGPLGEPAGGAATSVSVGATYLAPGTSMVWPARSG